MKIGSEERRCERWVKNLEIGDEISDQTSILSFLNLLPISIYLVSKIVE
jgi:hypothetical protein